MNVSLFTPDYSHLTGLLRHLNEEELQKLLENEEKLMNLIHDLKQIQDIEAEKEMLLTSNKSLSEYNLSKEPVLEEHRAQLRETHKIALELKNNLLEKKQKIASKEETQSQETILALLQAAASEADGEAELVVEQFLNIEMPVDDFLPKYLELRKLAHLRRIKSEKFSNLLDGSGSNINVPPTRPQRLRKPPSPPSTSPSLPYPSPAAQNNVPFLPVRQAPRPPYAVPNMPYPTPPMGVPFSYVPPYPGYQPPGYPNQMPPNYPHYR